MRILHVLDMALPHLSTGYAVRSNYILSNQKRIGLEPIVLTRYAHSACDNDGSSVEVQEGIPYLWGPSAESHFLSFKRIGPMASQDLYELALHSSQKRFRDRIADAVEEYAPDVIHVASPAANAEIAADVGRRKGVPCSLRSSGPLAQQCRSERAPGSCIGLLSRPTENFLKGNARCRFGGHPRPDDEGRVRGPGRSSIEN